MRRWNTLERIYSMWAKSRSYIDWIRDGGVHQRENAFCTSEKPLSLCSSSEISLIWDEFSLWCTPTTHRNKFTLIDWNVRSYGFRIRSKFKLNFHVLVIPSGGISTITSEEFSLVPNEIPLLEIQRVFFKFHSKRPPVWIRLTFRKLVWIPP